jgi:type I restriction enzyme S subunit
MSWQHVKVGDLITQVRGVTYSSGDAIDELKDGYVELLRANNIAEGHLTFNDVTYVPKSKVNEKQYLRQNDIVIAASSGSISVVGKAASFNVNRTATFGAFCKVLRPNANVDARYIANYFQTSTYRRTVSSLAEGANINNLRNEHIDNLDILLPPLAEQKRIAAILDKAAEIKAKREQAIAKLDELVASAFQESCSQSKKQTVQKIKNLVTKRKPVDRGSETVWSLVLDQIESNSGKVLSQVNVSREKLGTSTYYFQPEVVLYSKLRPYLNKVVIPDSCGYATTELVPLYCDKEKILPVFMASYLRSNKFVNFANSNSAGAKMPRVMMDKFWDYEMTLPDLGVQRNFQQLCEKCIVMKQSLNDAIEKHDKLIASLQHHAFTTVFAA